ncbi:MAG: hypothetical protein EB152_05795, partial [Euryarchaeota archaeon]|nr:hypothetical protein [Euryarchaeota archaeon]
DKTVARAILVPCFQATMYGVVAITRNSPNAAQSDPVRSDQRNSYSAVANPLPRASTGPSCA